MNIENYSAVILDFDGVVIDSENAQLEAWKWALTKHKHHIDEEKLLDTVGLPDEEIVRVLVGNDEISLRESVLNSKKIKTEEMFRSGKIKLIDGICEFIELIFTTHTLAIATNSRLEKIKIAFSLYPCLDEKYFSTIVTGEGQLRSKPHPDIYLETLRILQLPPNQCLVIEDSIFGLQSAAAAGLSRIGMTTMYDEQILSKYVDVGVIDSFRDLLE